MRWLTWFFIAVALSACGTFTKNPYQDVTIDSVNKSIIVAVTELRAVNLALRTVIEDGVISKRDAQRTLDHLTEVQATLILASNAVKLSGDPLKGRDLVDSALRTLDLALMILSPYLEKGPPVSSPTRLRPSTFQVQPCSPSLMKVAV